MKYDLEYHDEIKDRRFRVVTKPMTVRDGRACDRLGAEITKREDLDNYDFLFLLRYPNLLYGTHQFEVSYQQDGTWGEWLPLPITEALFWELPEQFILDWGESVIEKNPHRDTSFESLKKYLAANSATDNENNSELMPQNGKASD